MLDLLITLVIILLIVIGLIMAIDGLYKRRSVVALAAPAAPAAEPAEQMVMLERTRVEEDLPTEEQVQVLRAIEAAPETPRGTAEHLAELTRTCEETYAGRVSMNDLNETIRRIAQSEGLNWDLFNKEAAPRYNCDLFISELRKKIPEY